MGTFRRRSKLGVGVALLLAGVALLGFLVWPFLSTERSGDRAAAAMRDQLRQSWSRDGVRPLRVKQGKPFALLRIARLGRTWEEPIIEGVDEEALAAGVGHYPGTQLPGQIGNFAIAAHRVTHGSPFRELLTMKPGDRVIVETRDALYTYVIDTPASDLTVSRTDTSVLDPVPQHPKRAATEPLITLTTCRDFFRSDRRSVSFGHLVKLTPKSGRHVRDVVRTTPAVPPAA